MSVKEEDLKERVAASLKALLTADTARVWGARTTRTNVEADLGLPKDKLLEHGDLFQGLLMDRVKELETAEKEKEKSKPKEPSKEVAKPKKRPPPRREPAKKKRKTSVSKPAESSYSESSSSTEDSGSESSMPARKASRVSYKKAQERSMTRAVFLDEAETYDCKIGTLDFKLEPRVFSTGSCGWHFSNKLDLNVGGKTVKSTLSLNLTVIGSKAWKEGKQKKKKKERPVSSSESSASETEESDESAS